jgi:hypothetical protein
MDTAQKAPVAIFAYNRLWNTKEVITALQKNHLAGETDVFIYSDAAKGPRQEKGVAAVRSYLKTVTGFKSVTIIERERNYYIEQNIIQAVTQLVARFGKIIVLEDDGVTSPYFLTFMNNALTHYAEKKKVMHIGTFTFIDMHEDFNETFFWRYTENTGGGWGTWSDRWEKFQYFQNEAAGLASLTQQQKQDIQLDGAFGCLNSLSKNPIPWDICWYMTLVRNNGLAVQTPRSLTINNGLFNGTHFSPLNRVLGKNPFAATIDTGPEIILSDVIEENPQAIEKLAAFYSGLGSRKRDRALHAFVRMLVFFKITKVLKYFLK